MSYFLKFLGFVFLLPVFLMADQNNMFMGTIFLIFAAVFYVVGMVLEGESDYSFPSPNFSKGSESKEEDYSDLGYWQYKKKEEESEKAKWDEVLAKIDEKYSRWRDQEETIKNNRYEYERKKQEERAEREEKWRKGL